MKTRTTAMQLVLTLGVSACAGQGPWFSGYTERIGADLKSIRERVLIRREPITIGRHPQYMVLANEADSATNELMFGPGRSGAPTYLESGELVGFMVNSLWMGDIRSPGLIVDAKAVFEVADQGRCIRPPNLISTAENPAPQLIPGAGVYMLWVWGDAAWGTSGVLSVRQGTDVVLFGHHSTTDFGALQCAIATARLIGSYPSREASRTVYEVGQVVGATLLNSSAGVYGVLGVEPECWPISITPCETQSHPARRYSIARHDLMLDRALAFALADAGIVAGGLGAATPDKIAVGLVGDGQVEWEQVDARDRALCLARVSEITVAEIRTREEARLIICCNARHTHASENASVIDRKSGR